MSWEDDFLPEVWYLELTPIERISKLNIAPIIDRLDSQVEPESDLRIAFLIGDRLLLLGSRPGAADKNDESNLMVNAYFEFSLHRLCAHN